MPKPERKSEGSEPRLRPAPPPPPPPELPPPPPGVSAGGRVLSPSAGRQKGLTMKRAEVALPDGTVIGTGRLVIYADRARLLGRRSEVLWESSLHSWVKDGSSRVTLQLTAKRAATARQVR